jgi:hypothetical protein
MKKLTQIQITQRKRSIFSLSIMHSNLGFVCYFFCCQIPLWFSVTLIGGDKNGKKQQLLSWSGQV